MDAKKKKNEGRCLLCKKKTGRENNPLRPLCDKCEKHAPTCMSAPGLFMDSTTVPGLLAKATYEQAKKG